MRELKASRENRYFARFFSLAGGVLFHNDFHSARPANLFVSDRFRRDLPRSLRNYPQSPQPILLKLRLDGFGTFVARRLRSGAGDGEIFEPARERFGDFGL